jgi:hypothetical protein
MNVEELREQLEQLAGPLRRATPEAREGVRRRVRRSRRRMSVGTAAASVLVAVLVVAIVGAGLRDSKNPTLGLRTVPSTNPPAGTPDCRPGVRTVPENDVPRDVAAWAHGAPVVGGGELWTLRSAIAVAAIHENGAWRLKFPWFARPFGLPLINGRRLDGPGSFRPEVNRAVDGSGTWVASGLVFSAPGCWEVTARFDHATLSFRILVGNPPRPLAIGTITGTLREVGGPAPGLDRSIGGSIRITGSSANWEGTTTGSGGFSVDLPVGRYSVTGGSSFINDGRSQCFAAGPVVVARGRTTTADVICSID